MTWDSEDGSRKVIYTPFKKQGSFHLNKAPYRLFGGAAGPGKTRALLFEAISVCIHGAGESPDNGKQVRSLLLRRTIPQLEGSLLAEFRKTVPREIYRQFHEQKKTCEFWNGATLRFGSVQHKESAWDYQGHEYAFIGFDELTQFLFKQWTTLQGWNRCSILQATMAGASNPIGIGAVWVRSEFIKHKPAPERDDPYKYHPEDYAFIPATIHDNPIYLYDPDYLRRLDQMPRRLREALLRGDWDVPIGAYFDNFEIGEMTLRAERVEREYWWPTWVSMDYGFEHHAALYWHTIAPKQEGRSPICYTYREVVVNHTGPEHLAELIVERSRRPQDTAEQRDVVQQHGEFDVPEAIFVGASPGVFGKLSDAETIDQQMAKVLRRHKFPPPQRAADDRVGGWMLMYQMLDAGTWLITDNCERLIDTLPVCVRDETNVEDIAKFEGDDPVDGARYGLYSRFKDKTKLAPLGQRVAEHVTSEDPTVRAIQAKKGLLAEAKKGRAIMPARLRYIKRGTDTLWQPR